MLLSESTPSLLEQMNVVRWSFQSSSETLKRCAAQRSEQMLKFLCRWNSQGGIVYSVKPKLVPVVARKRRSHPGPCCDTGIAHKCDTVAIRSTKIRVQSCLVFLITPHKEALESSPSCHQHGLCHKGLGRQSVRVRARSSGVDLGIVYPSSVVGKTRKIRLDVTELIFLVTTEASSKNPVFRCPAGDSWRRARPVSPPPSSSRSRPAARCPVYTPPIRCPPARMP